MKLFLVVLFMLALTHCGKGKLFTIVNKASSSEKVGIFYKVDEASSHEEYILGPSQCVSVYAEEFKELKIKATRGGFEGVGVGFKTLCGEGTLPVCSPGNYEIVDTGRIFDDYQLVSVEERQDTDNCTFLLN